MALVLLAVSPVLRTLTEATTSDSIWALAAVLFALHLVLADYSSTWHSYSHNRTSHGGQGKLTNALSFNAAISASVVLASRLQTNIDTFTLITLAITLFAPSPHPHHPHYPCGPTSEVTSFAAKYAATIAAAATLGGGTAEVASWVRVVVVVWTNLVVVFISAVCPYWIRRAQAWKFEISGPWDPAEPLLCTDTTKLN